MCTLDCAVTTTCQRITIKHTKAVLAVDLVQMAILQGLVNERVNQIDANKDAIDNKGAEPGGALEASLLQLRDTLRRVTRHQLYS
jgi:hypothetical protein